MTFRPETVETFLQLFDERSEQIRSFPGCDRLELVRSAESEHIISTISVWSSEEALHHYRSSEVFRQTWSLAKELFADRPQAETQVVLRQVKSPL